MNIKNTIEQLESLTKDRESFLEENGVGDEIFRADIEALEIAML